MYKETITIRIVEEDGSFLEYTKTTSIPVEGDYLEKMREYEEAHGRKKTRISEPMSNWKRPVYREDAVHQSSMRDIMDAIDEYIQNDRNWNY